MKKIKALSIALALALIVSLFPMAVFAAGDNGEAVTSVAPEQAEEYEEIISDIEMNGLEGGTLNVAAAYNVTPVNLNSSETATEYYTKANETNTINMPSAGTLLVVHSSSYNSCAKVNGSSSSTYTTNTNGVYSSYWYLGSAGTPKLVFSENTYFKVYYVPATMKITPNSTAREYAIGRPDSSSSVSSFQVNVTSPGYLDLMIGDEIQTYSVYYKTSGYSDFEYLSASDARRFVAVQKGVYTFYVKSYTPMYGVKIKLNTVKQGKYGTKKKKAKAIKRKSTRKGLIITNAKKAHWYKFKNTKTKKVKIYVNGYMSNGGSYGGLKVTLYDKKRAIGTSYITPGRSSVTITPYTFGKKGKLVKGTYRIKVESYRGGNGYFTVKWK